jgi:hypothetical protein
MLQSNAHARASLLTTIARRILHEFPSFPAGIFNQMEWKCKLYQNFLAMQLNNNMIPL